MSEGVVHNRVSRFLGEYLPFSYLKEEDLLEIAKRTQVKFYDKGETIFEEGGQPPSHFYVIQQGSVELIYDDNGKEVLSELCDLGDIFGLKALLGKRNYINTSRAHEETLLLVIPYSAFQPHIEKSAKIAMYFAAGFSSGRSKINMSKLEEARKSLSTKPDQSNPSIQQADSTLVHKDREVIHCMVSATIKEVALLMTKKKVGSILVLDIEDRPIGIVTDVDFRKKVVAEEIPLNEKVSRIMSSPVATVSKNITLAETIITMMQRNIRHLCVTVDGTDQSPVEGIITEHDILLLQGNTPAVITKEMSQSNSMEELRKLRNQAEDLLRQYVAQELSMSFIFEMITQVNDILITRIIQLKIEEMESEGMIQPDIRFAWLSLGSEGRKEQALRTDQDNAIVYEDPQPQEREKVNSYFLELGKRVCKGLYDCGFAYCKGEIMAENPKWCASLSQWKQYYENWIQSPTPQAIMHFSIFFDFRSVYGEESIERELDEFISKKMKENPTALRLLAINAIANSPPISLFRGLSVERHGEHKDHFDIKAKGTMPIVDSARVLALEANITKRNTIERYRELGRRDPDHKEEYEELIITFELLSRIRMRNSLEHPELGNFVNPKTLHKIEKESMKYSFQIIQALQKKIEVHFRLDLIPR